MARILIADDEVDMVAGLRDNLQFEGYDVVTAPDGEEALKAAMEQSPDIVLLDIMMPKMDGLEVCRRIRQAGFMIPVLMLTAKSQEIDRVLGLELGADDYVTKPFSSRELLARIKAILRRAKQPHRGIDSCRFGDVEVDFAKYEATKNGRPVPLTALEFALLQFLAQNRGRVVDRNEVLDAVWGKDVFVDARTVDKHISLLRKKFEDDPQEPKYIQSVRGVGYKFAE